ncbi:unnamed protein product [Parnassius mnemosyne]|uniref:PiggyBac transposable element-derived protein domain-containing protein n=1 Tax=Parnassius mnemosyne TaxID=213953 RepID=A0AAV1M2F3_9NEOP
MNNGWSYTVRDLQRLPFTAEERLGVDVESHSTVESIFCYIIDDEFLDMLFGYAAQISSDAGRLARWKDVDRNMMKKFLGIILYTGIVVKPTLECYWKKDPIYYHPLMHKLGMSYNTFTLMLRCWHFADNSAPRNPNNRLYKVQPLVDKIVNKSQQLLTPGDCVIIDESMVPFKGRLLFRQYNPSKTNKYGIKIYKLCTADGYTWNYEIYCGDDETIENLDKPGSIVVKLCRNLLVAGRLIVADNFDTSFPLATYLLANQTDLCGTLRKNRKHLPEYAKAKKLQRGEVIASQKENVTVSKWRDKRDVLMISTCHSDEMCRTRQRNPKPKPKVVLEYNSKKGIDFSDQLCSYQSPIRKSLIWYKKIAIDMIFSVAITNSVVVYNKLHPTAVPKEK